MTLAETAMNSSNKYAPGVRDPAVRMVLEHQSAHDSQWAAIGSIAEKIALGGSQSLIGAPFLSAPGFLCSTGT